MLPVPDGVLVDDAVPEPVVLGLGVPLAVVVLVPARRLLIKWRCFNLFNTSYPCQLAVQFSFETE